MTYLRLFFLVHPSAVHTENNVKCKHADNGEEHRDITAGKHIFESCKDFAEVNWCGGCYEATPERRQMSAQTMRFAHIRLRSDLQLNTKRENKQLTFKNVRYYVHRWDI